MKSLHKHAIISKCERYRYKLTRTWDEDKGKVLFIMLNPSTANHIQNDLTTIRCINFAEKWGYGGIMIGNIYPYRTKRPKHLRQWMKMRFKEDYPEIDRYNKDHVYEMAQQADMIVCAWGCNHKGMPEWIHDLADYRALHYLELCDDGITPKHPLGNLSKDLVPKRYKLNTIIEG